MMLLQFKKELEEIRGVLKAKEDQLADFDPEDFNRMENEDQRSQDQKLKRLETEVRNVRAEFQC